MVVVGAEEVLDVAGNHGAHTVDTPSMGVHVGGHHGHLHPGGGGLGQVGGVGREGGSEGVGQHRACHRAGNGDCDSLDRLLVHVGKSFGRAVITHILFNKIRYLKS